MRQIGGWFALTCTFLPGEVAVVFHPKVTLRVEWVLLVLMAQPAERWVFKGEKKVETGWRVEWRC